jgi:hypothetical protein
MTATRPYAPSASAAALTKRPIAPAGRPPIQAAENAERGALIQHAKTLLEQARISAESGDVAASAQAILQALNCERRAGGLGPQVLQLIKPR